MIVRIHLRKGQPLRRTRGKNRELALACGALLVPAALMAYVLGFWRLTSDLGMTNEFAIRGLFSHWQIWIVTAVVLHVANARDDSRTGGSVRKGDPLAQLLQLCVV